jgi:hypothetical protein
MAGVEVSAVVKVHPPQLPKEAPHFFAIFGLCSRVGYSSGRGELLKQLANEPGCNCVPQHVYRLKE